MPQIKNLIEIAFDNGLTEAEEALLDILEAEWLARQRAVELEDFDYYSYQAMPKTNKVAHT